MSLYYISPISRLVYNNYELLSNMSGLTIELRELVSTVTVDFVTHGSSSIIYLSLLVYELLH